MRPLPSPLLAVSDRCLAGRPLAEVATAVARGGGGWFWLRDRDMAPAVRRELAVKLRTVTRHLGVTLSVGADAELAAACGADGVHLSRIDAIPPARRLLGEHAWIGLSAHTLADLSSAAEVGADYATFSPVFETSSKPGYGPACGLDGLRAAAALDIPVVALGGVTPERVAGCRKAGAAGIAAMGSIMAAADVAAAVRSLLAAWQGGGVASG